MIKLNHLTLGILAILTIWIIIISGCVQQETPSKIPTTTQPFETPLIQPTTKYDPRINPTDFSSNVSNKYYTLTPGKKMVYKAETEDGTERIEVYVTHEMKEVIDVETIIVWDRVWLNDGLVEETYDWYAQDKDGNVWYFGEDSKTLIDGKVVSTKGSWEAGIDGAKPGIIMKANPHAGDSYRQEYYRGVAEDMADVLALNESVIAPISNFSNCVKTLDYTPLEPDVKEYKYYCPEAKGVVLEVDTESGERVELVSVEYGAEPSPSTVEKKEQLKGNITEAEAKEIALKKVPGVVTDIVIERKFGKITFVVEVDADTGPETDVIIDINTGEVLGIEK